MAVDDVSPTPGGVTPVDAVARARAVGSRADAVALYAAWAERYDDDVFERLGVIGSDRIAELLHDLVDDPTAPIVDLGCGTGAVGRRLAELGHRRIVGIDLSPEMLALAQQTDAYEALHVGDLHELAAEVGAGAPEEPAGSSIRVPGGFAAAVSAGTFTTGHVDASAVPGMLSLLRPGAVLAWVVAPAMWPGFEAALLAHGAVVLTGELAPVRRTGSDSAHYVVAQLPYAPPTSITLADLDLDHHGVFDGLREHGPVVRVPALDAWVVTDRETAVRVLRDAESFTVDDPRFATAQVVGPSMLSLDGAEHRRHRGPFATAYRPAETSRRSSVFIDDTARRLVRGVAGSGSADLRAVLAAPLATIVAAHALGLGSTDPDDLLGWYREIVAATERAAVGDEPGDAARRAHRELGAAVLAAAAVPDSVLATIAAGLTPDELVSNAAVFLFGGIETTEAMIANLLFHLLSHQGALEAVRDDRTLVDAAIEESLRLEPAAARVDRYATTDTDLGAVRVANGDFVIVSLSAANRDPSVVDHPHRFDLHRPPGTPGHLAFVQGPHACLGAPLARMEARAALNAVLDLLPGLRLDGTTGVRGVVFRKVHSLPVRWDPVR